MSYKNVDPDSLIPLSPDTLVVGEPLPYAIYSPKGKLLAAENYIFKNENQVAAVKHGVPMRVNTEFALQKPKGSVEFADSASYVKPSGSVELADDSGDAKPTGSVELADSSGNSKPSGSVELAGNSGDAKPKGSVELANNSSDTRPKGSIEIAGSSREKRPKGSVEIVDNSRDANISLAQPSGNIDNITQVPSATSDQQNPLPPIESMNELVRMIRQLFKALTQTPSIVPRLLANMESEIFRLIHQEQDTAIGFIHMTPITSQAEHCVFAAFLAAIYSKTLGYPERYCKLVTTSAICMNVGAIKLHHQLNSNSGELTQEHLSEIRKHPKASANLIQQSGIKHPTIINAILHHHERPDGKGYPVALSSGEIPDEALIIGIVDTYLAMIGPRAYREKTDPKEALKKVLFEGHKYDKEFYTTFIKAIGVYPAGTFYTLTNGDVVVVTKRTSNNLTRPEICRVLNAKGQSFKSFKKMHLNDLDQDIKTPYSDGHLLEIKPSAIWQ